MKHKTHTVNQSTVCVFLRLNVVRLLLHQRSKSVNVIANNCLFIGNNAP